MNKENLELLAKLLERKVDPKHFHMRYVASVHGLSLAEPEEVPAHLIEPGCGTVACALGHAPLVIPAKLPSGSKN